MKFLWCYLILFGSCWCISQGFQTKPNLLEVARALNLTTFLNGINQCGQHKNLDHEGNFQTESFVILCYCKLLPDMNILRLMILKFLIYI